MIKIAIISQSAINTTFKITESPRDDSFVYKAGYITFLSDTCPEFIDNCLYVWGNNTSEDSIAIEVSHEDYAKLICSIQEYNDNLSGNITTTYEKCCGHYYLNALDCVCNIQPCHICGASHNKQTMRLIVEQGINYYICKSHKKTIKCPVCDTKGYFLLDSRLHPEIKVCPSCLNTPLKLGKQYSHNHKPYLMFHDILNGKKVCFGQDNIIGVKNKNLSNKFWMGHEIEQQFPFESNRLLLIGDMESRQKNFIFCKHDGSIGNGTECVTMPHSWEFYKAHNWDGILNKHLTDHRKSGQSVGHHVHMHLDAFTRMHLYKFLKFHHTHLKWVEYISQRQLKDYCRPTGGAMQKALHKGKHGDKYEFLNVTGSTLEWRAFASPMSLLEFKKNAEYLHAAFTWTKETHQKMLTAFELEKFILKNQAEYPNLVAWLLATADKETIRHTRNAEASYSKWSGHSRPINQPSIFAPINIDAIAVNCEDITSDININMSTAAYISENVCCDDEEDCDEYDED